MEHWGKAGFGQYVKMKDCYRHRSESIVINYVNTEKGGCGRRSLVGERASNHPISVNTRKNGYPWYTYFYKKIIRISKNFSSAYIKSDKSLSSNTTGLVL